MLIVLEFQNVVSLFQAFSGNIEGTGPEVRIHRFICHVVQRSQTLTNSSESEIHFTGLKWITECSKLGSPIWWPWRRFLMKQGITIQYIFYLNRTWVREHISYHTSWERTDSSGLVWEISEAWAVGISSSTLTPPSYRGRMTSFELS